MAFCSLLPGDMRHSQIQNECYKTTVNGAEFVFAMEIVFFSLIKRQSVYQFNGI